MDKQGSVHAAKAEIHLRAYKSHGNIADWNAADDELGKAYDIAMANNDHGLLDAIVPISREMVRIANG